MSKKIIEIEEREGPFKAMLHRVMHALPENDRNHKNLQRLIAFRIEVDGETATIAYIKEKTKEAKKSAHKGSLYDFLKDEIDEKNNPSSDGNSDPPIVA